MNVPHTAAVLTIKLLLEDIIMKDADASTPHMVAVQTISRPLKEQTSKDVPAIHSSLVVVLMELQRPKDHINKVIVENKKKCG